MCNFCNCLVWSRHCAWMHLLNKVRYCTVILTFLLKKRTNMILTLGAASCTIFSVFGLCLQNLPCLERLGSHLKSNININSHNPALVLWSKRTNGIPMHWNESTGPKCKYEASTADLEEDNSSTVVARHLHQSFCGLAWPRVCIFSLWGDSTPTFLRTITFRLWPLSCFFFRKT